MGIRFRLGDMFLWVTAACVGLAIERTLGAFFLMLVCGLIVIATLVRLLNVESVMAGAVGGFMASLVIFQATAAFQQMQDDPALFTAGCFAYLALGLSVGMITVADHMIREGR